MEVIPHCIVHDVESGLVLGFFGFPSSVQPCRFVAVCVWLRGRCKAVEIVCLMCANGFMCGNRLCGFLCWY